MRKGLSLRDYFNSIPFKLKVIANNSSQCLKECLLRFEDRKCSSVFREEEGIKQATMCQSVNK